MMMTFYTKIRLLICQMALLCLLMVMPPLVVAQQDNMVTLNFVNADIESVVKAVGEVTNKNFIIDPRVKGQINVISAKPVPRSKVYDLLLSALRMQGFAAVESGGFVRIVPEGDAKLLGGDLTTKPSAGGDRVQTQIFKLHHENATQMITVLKPLISQNSSITAAQGTNSLVITDYASNLDRLAKIIASIDKPTSDNVELIPVRHMSAIDLSAILNQVYGVQNSAAGAKGAQGGTNMVDGMTIVPEPRTNALMIRGATPARLAGVMNLIHKLDTPTGATGNIHVVYLRNAEAIKLAAVLRSVLDGDSSSLSAAFDKDSSSSFGGLSGGSGASLSSFMGSGSGGSGGVTGGSSTSGLGSSFSNSSSSMQETFSSLIDGGTGSNKRGGMIQADPMTNSLIINAPPPVYRNLRAVIDLLDARRAQVFVESLIVEVTSDTAAEFGIQWFAGSGFDKNGTNVVGGTNFGEQGQGEGNIFDVMAGFNQQKTGLNIGVVNGTVNIPGIGRITNLNFLAHALEAGGKTNILSTPNMLTLDNEEATIIVGQNIPIQSGSYTNTGSNEGSVNPFSTFNRQDVGITLKIRPQISESGSVRLQIYQEISSIAGNAVGGGGFITNKRAIESQVLVDDGQIVVLGGLVQDSLEGGEEGIPVLGKIPVLGYLFKNETRKRTKTNLMIFLRPYILRDPSGSQQVTNSRYDYIQAIQQKARFEDTVVLPDLGAPTMPDKNSGTPPTLYPNDNRQPTAPIEQSSRNGQVHRPVFYSDKTLENVPVIGGDAANTGTGAVSGGQNDQHSAYETDYEGGIKLDSTWNPTRR